MPNANEALGSARFNPGEFGFENFFNFDILASKCQADDVLRVEVNQLFGNRIVFCQGEPPNLPLFEQLV